MLVKPVLEKGDHSDCENCRSISIVNVITFFQGWCIKKRRKHKLDVPIAFIDSKKMHLME